jgi:hypothetical protein
LPVNGRLPAPRIADRVRGPCTGSPCHRYARRVPRSSRDRRFSRRTPHPGTSGMRRPGRARRSGGGAPARTPGSPWARWALQVGPCGPKRMDVPQLRATSSVPPRSALASPSSDACVFFPVLPMSHDDPLRVWRRWPLGRQCWTRQAARSHRPQETTASTEVRGKAPCTSSRCSAWRPARYSA